MWINFLVIFVTVISLIDLIMLFYFSWRNYKAFEHHSKKLNYKLKKLDSQPVEEKKIYIIFYGKRWEDR